MLSRSYVCGLVPTAGVRITYTPRSGNHLGPITITVTGPTTVKEVADKYQEVLKKAKVSPRSLSHKHALLIKLVYQMPIGVFTWPERLRRWLEWKQEDNALADLPTWGAKLDSSGSIVNERSASQNMSREYKRADLRTTWTGKPTPKLPKSPRTPHNPKLSELPPLPWEEN